MVVSAHVCNTKRFPKFAKSAPPPPLPAWLPSPAGSFSSAPRSPSGAVAAPCIIPASALGLNGAVPPSERIVLGGMGVGNRGTDDLRWMLPEKDVQFVAICDAKKSPREAVKRIVDTKYGNKDCAMYRDMREFLAQRTDIDALLIATGDRWHARPPSWPCAPARTSIRKSPPR